MPRKGRQPYLCKPRGCTPKLPESAGAIMPPKGRQGSAHLGWYTCTFFSLGAELDSRYRLALTTAASRLIHSPSSRASHGADHSYSWDSLS